MNKSGSSASPNDKYRQMALSSLKARARAEQSGKAPGSLKEPIISPASRIKNGITLSDNAAKLIAAAISQMLKS